MKRFLLLMTLFAAPLITWAGPGVGVSVNVGQPGFYGQIDLGAMPAPPVVHSTPVVIQPVPGGVIYPPMYLRVPPAHYQNWRYYCGRYNACGRPVYFVNDAWYRNTYVPYYRGHYPNHYYPNPHHNQRYYYDNGHRYYR
jgi:hypothetical protein